MLCSVLLSTTASYHLVEPFLWELPYQDTNCPMTCIKQGTLNVSPQPYPEGMSSLLYLNISHLDFISLMSFHILHPPIEHLKMLFVALKLYTHTAVTWESYFFSPPFKQYLPSEETSMSILCH